MKGKIALRSSKEGISLEHVFVTRTASFCGVSKATVSRVMSDYHHKGQTISNRSNCGCRGKLSLQNEMCTKGSIFRIRLLWPNLWSLVPLLHSRFNSVISRNLVGC